MIVDEHANIDAIIESFGDDLFVIKFSAEWCGPCKSYNPVLDMLESEHDIGVIHVDISVRPDLGERYRIMSVPTTHIYKYGKSVHSFVGAKPLGALLDEIGRYA